MLPPSEEFAGTQARETLWVHCAQTGLAWDFISLSSPIALACCGWQLLQPAQTIRNYSVLWLFYACSIFSWDPSEEELQAATGCSNYHKMGIQMKSLVSTGPVWSMQTQAGKQTSSPKLTVVSPDASGLTGVSTPSMPWGDRENMYPRSQSRRTERCSNQVGPPWESSFSQTRK